MPSLAALHRNSCYALVATVTAAPALAQDNSFGQVDAVAGASFLTEELCATGTFGPYPVDDPDQETLTADNRTTLTARAQTSENLAEATASAHLPSGLLQGRAHISGVKSRPNNGGVCDQLPLAMSLAHVRDELTFDYTPVIADWPQEVTLRAAVTSSISTTNLSGEYTYLLYSLIFDDTDDPHQLSNSVQLEKSTFVYEGTQTIPVRFGLAGQVSAFATEGSLSGTTTFRGDVSLGPLPPGVTCRSASGFFPGCDLPDLKIAHVALTQPPGVPLPSLSDWLPGEFAALVISPSLAGYVPASTRVLIDTTVGATVDSTTEILDPNSPDAFSSYQSPPFLFPLTATIRVTIDPDNLVHESDETNNEYIVRTTDRSLGPAYTEGPSMIQDQDTVESIPPPQADSNTAPCTRSTATPCEIEQDRCDAIDIPAPDNAISTLLFPVLKLKLEKMKAEAGCLLLPPED